MRGFVTGAVVLALLSGGSAAFAADRKPKPFDTSFTDKLERQEVALDPRPKKEYQAGHLDPTLPQFTRDPKIEAAAYGILNKLLQQLPEIQVTFNFRLADASDMNCITEPTGEIFCSSQFLQFVMQDTTSGEDRMAFLLAHELGHRLIASHGERLAGSNKLKANMANIGMMVAVAGSLALSQHTMSGNTLTITPTATSGATAINAMFGGIYAGEAVDGLVSPAWSQKEEDEADQFAIWLMNKAGYDVFEASHLFGDLSEYRRLRGEHGMMVTMATGALSGAATQALMNGGGWLNAAFGAGAGAAQAWGKTKTDHYHRADEERARHCSEIAAHVRGPTTPETVQQAFNDDDAKSQPLVLAALEPSKSIKTARRGKGGARPGREPTSQKQTVSPPTAWEIASRDGAKTLAEIRLSHEVRVAILKTGGESAVGLCPERIATSALALSCGLAYVAAKHPDRARPLLSRSVANPDAGVRDFTDVASAQAQMAQIPQAVATLDEGDRRFPGGRFFPTRIKLLAESGDVAGAKAAADTCVTGAEAEFRPACRRLLEELRKG